MQIYKLVSGEVIMGDVEVHGATLEVTMTQPYSLMFQNDGEKVSLALAPYIPFAKNDTILISNHAIIYQAEAADALEAEYRRIVSPIVLPSSASGKIIT